MSDGRQITALEALSLSKNALRIFTRVPWVHFWQRHHSSKRSVCSVNNTLKCIFKGHNMNERKRSCINVVRIFIKAQLDFREKS